MRIDGSELTLSFSHVGAGLISKDSGPLRGFAVAGDDRKFTNALARIVADLVVVSSPQVAKPTAVRYAWADYPLVNFYNRDGLPAAPFRSDD